MLLTAANAPLTVTIAKKTAAYSYEFEWPADAAAIPELDALLRSKAEEARTRFVANAETSYRKARTGKDGWFPEVGYQLNWGYHSTGESEALLSLAGDWYSYEGGAHGISGAHAMLWDRRRKSLIETAMLFDRHAEFALMRPAMCAALDKERRSRRGSESLNSDFDSLDDAFNGCPKFGELTIWVSDSDHNGRFDTFIFAADPYVAGPYAEGAYEMKVEVTDRMIAALRPEYQPSFEVQPPRQ